MDRVTHVLDSGAGSHTNGVMQIRSETPLLGVNPARIKSVIYISFPFRASRWSDRLHVLDESQLLPNSVHQGVQPEPELSADNNVPPVVLLADFLNRLDRDGVDLVEDVETRHIFSRSEEYIDKLVRCNLHKGAFRSGREQQLANILRKTTHIFSEHHITIAHCENVS